MSRAPGYVNRPISDNPRDTEAWALTEAARRLANAARQPDDLAALQAALSINQRLWTIFQAAVTEADCPLPPQLRQNVLTLSMIVDRETTARMFDGDAGKLDLLININRQVAGGLSASPAPAQPKTAPPPPPAHPGMPAGAARVRIST